MEKILISTLLIFSLSLFVLSLYLHIQLKKKIKRLMTKKAQYTSTKSAVEMESESKNVEEASS